MADTMTLILCRGVEGDCIYLNNHRIVGPKPWGGGTTIKEWKVTRNEVLRALGEKTSDSATGNSEAEITAAARPLYLKPGLLPIGYVRCRQLAREVLRAARRVRT